MLFDPSRNDEPGGYDGPWCTRCNQPIGDEPSEHIAFPQDPHGHQGLSGHYHQRCAKPFSSLARIMNMRLP